VLSGRKKDGFGAVGMEEAGAGPTSAKTRLVKIAFQIRDLVAGSADDFR
jgi:hypothetical protein